MAAPRLADELRVGDIMTTDPRTVDRNQTLDVADGLISGLRIRHLPVVDGARVVGVLSQRDLFQAALATVLDRGTLVGLVTESDLLRHAHGL